MARRSRELRDEILDDHADLAKRVARGEASEQERWALFQAVTVANMMDARAANSTQALMGMLALEKGRREFARHLLHDGSDGKLKSLRGYLETEKGEVVSEVQVKEG